MINNGFIMKEDIHKTIGQGKKATFYATESEEIVNFIKNYRENYNIKNRGE